MIKMAVFDGPRFMALGILLIMLSSASQSVCGQQCRGDLPGLITQCSMYVQKQGPQTDPSQACCDVVKSVDIPCLCNYVTKEIEQMIDMDKAVHVIAFCGKPLSHGTKCGSYTVP